MIMALPAGAEWIFIIAIVVVAFFGVKKIPELARSFGRATGEYQLARLEATRELRRLKESGTPEKSRLAEIAITLGIDSDGKNEQQLRAAINNELNKRGPEN